MPSRSNGPPALPLPTRRGGRDRTLLMVIVQSVSLFWLALTFALVALGSAAPSRLTAQTPADATGRREFEQLAQRYEEILTRNPRPGPAFDLWYRHYLDAGKLDELSRRVRQRLDATAGDWRWRLLSGMVAERGGRSAEAEEAYRQVETVAADGHVAPWLLGELLAGEGRAAEAMEALQRAADRGPPPVDLLAIYRRLGHLQLQHDQPQAAVATWDRLASLFPEDRRLLEELAELLTEQQLYGAALERWRQLARQSGDDPAAAFRAKLAAAGVLFLQGERAAAVDTVDALLDEIEPESWQAELVRDRVRQWFLSADDVAGWIAFWQERQTRGRDPLACRVELARALAAAERTEEALTELRDAVRLAPTRRDLHQALIDRLRAAGRRAEAVRAASELVEQHPGDADGWELLGRLLLEGPRPEERESSAKQAMEAWRKLARLRPDDPSLSLRAAELCREAARGVPPNRPAADGALPPVDGVDQALLDAAEQFYREAVQRSSGGDRYLEYLGEFLHARGKAAEALRTWKQVVQSPREDAGSWRRLWELCRRFGYPHAAVQAATHAVATGTPPFAWRVEFVEALVAAGQIERADQQLAVLQRLAAGPEQEDQALELSVAVNKAAGRLDAGIEKLRDRLEEGSGSPADYRRLAMMLAQGSGAGEAIVHLREGIELSPDNAALRRQYAQLLEQSGRALSAAEQYRKLMELEPRLRPVHARKLVELHRDSGDFEEARRLLDQLLEDAPRNLELLELSADLALRRGDDERALEALRRAVQLEPGDRARRRRLAETLAQCGKEHEAREHFARCFEQAETLDEKQGLAVAMAAHTRSEAERSGLAERLLAARFQQEDPAAATLCAAAVWRHSGQYEKAEEVLRASLAHHPRHAETLRRLAELARIRQDFVSAADYQRRVAELEDRPPDWELLAADYQASGERGQALRIWRTLLRRTRDDTTIRGVVDRQLSEGRWDEALALADWAVGELPESWSLQYRAALSNLALSRLDDALARFESLRKWKPAAAAEQSVVERGRPATPAPAPLHNSAALKEPLRGLQDNACPALGELQRATVAYARWMALRQDPSSSAGTGGAARSEQERLKALNTMPSTLEAAQTEALIATYVIAVLQGRAARWEQQRWDEHAAGRPAALREIVLAQAAAGRPQDCWDEIAELAERYDEDALPHLVRSTADLSDSAAGRRAVTNQRPRYSAPIHASYQWLEGRHAALARALRGHVAMQLIELGDIAAVSRLLQQAIDTAGSLSELSALTTIVLRAQEGTPRRALLEKAVAAPAGTSLPAEDLGRMLDALLADGRRPAYDAEEVVWLMQLFVRLASLPSSDVRGTAAAPQADAASDSGYAGRDFPAATPLLDERRAGWLRGIFGLAHQQQLLSRFEQVLRDSQDKADMEGKHRLRMARVFVLWWRGDPELALRELRSLCDQRPEDAALRFALARGHYARKQFPETLRALDAMISPAPPVAGAAQELRAEISQRWSGDSLLHVMEGHGGVVRDIAFSPDGTRLVSGSVDRTLGIWDIQTGKRLRSIAGHEDIVLSVAWSPDGRIIASAGYDRVVRFWNPDTGEAQGTLAGHEGPIRSLAFSPGGELLASAGDQGKIRLWHVAEHRRLAELEGHDGAAPALGFSRDGRTLASGGADGRVVLWDVGERKLLHRLEGHAGPVSAVVFAPGDDLLYSAGEDKAVIVRQRETGAIVRRQTVSEQPIRALAVSPGGGILAWGGEQRVVSAAEASDGRVLQTLRGHGGTIQAIAFSPQGKLLASAGFDGRIHVWQLDRETRK